MVEQKIPLFYSGNLLTQDMLESLKNYAIRSNELGLSGYADGILCGCKLTSNENEITVHKGILILDEQQYFIDKPVSIRYRPTNNWLVLRAVIGDEEKTDSFIVKQLTIELVEEDRLRERDIELCRFKLQHGAVLRTDFRNFNDLNTEYDTIHLLEAKHAAYGKSTIAPEILISFVNQAVLYGIKEPLDEIFCQQVLNLHGRAMERDAIQFYIAQKLGEEFKDQTNGGIYKELAKILQSIKSGKSEKRAYNRREQRIIID